MKKSVLSKLGSFKKVSNMMSPSGREVANQFILDFENGRVFQSYDEIIVVQFYYNEKLGKHSNQTYFGEAWNYSSTTSKYRNLFLDRDSKWCKDKVTSNEIKVLDL